MPSIFVKHISCLHVSGIASTFPCYFKCCIESVIIEILKSRILSCLNYMCDTTVSISDQMQSFFILHSTLPSTFACRFCLTLRQQGGSMIIAALPATRPTVQPHTDSACQRTRLFVLHLQSERRREHHDCNCQKTMRLEKVTIMHHSVVVAIAWKRMTRDVVVIERPSVQLCCLSDGRYTNFTNDTSVIQVKSSFSLDLHKGSLGLCLSSSASCRSLVSHSSFTSLTQPPQKLKDPPSPTPSHLESPTCTALLCNIIFAFLPTVCSDILAIFVLFVVPSFSVENILFFVYWILHTLHDQYI